MMHAAFLLLVLAQAREAPLADAAERADWPRVRALLEKGADPKQPQADGMTALHWAAHHDSLAAARLLLEAKADVKAANRYGVTPLSTACVNGDEALVALLLEAGADPNTTLTGGESALMTASRTGRPGPVKTLIDRGARIDATDAKGQTALLWAAADGHAEVVQLLLKAGADAHARLKSGFTPLLVAAREGRSEVLEVLLKAGADPKEAIAADQRRRGGPKTGTSALILAVENGHYELALRLVKAGADPNDQRSGYAPLHTLTWVRKPHRGDGEDGQPPPQGSGSVTSLEFARELVKLGADTKLQLAKGSSGAGVLSSEGATPVLLAAHRADLPYLKLLVELGADPLVANKEGSTPLMAAAGLGTQAPTEEAGTEAEAIETVKYLLAAGADVNAVDRNGETAMHGAAYKSFPKVVQQLAANGAKIDVWNRKNTHGWTPLIIAEGFRPGNFKPSVETLAAIHEVMKENEVTPPPPTPRPDPVKDRKGYDADPKDGKGTKKEGANPR
jgi:ankyrin repeat protein